MSQPPPLTPHPEGRITLPQFLPLSTLATLITLVVLASLGWKDLHARNDVLHRELESVRQKITTVIADSKQKDAEFTAALSLMREQTSSRQEAILTRLTRIETILERDRLPNDTPPRPR